MSCHNIARGGRDAITNCLKGLVVMRERRELIRAAFQQNAVSSGVRNQRIEVKEYQGVLDRLNGKK